MGIVSNDSVSAINATAHRPFNTNDGIKPTIMHCKRDDVKATNKKELDALNGETITYAAVNDNGLTDTEITACGAPDLLTLKVQ